MPFHTPNFPVDCKRDQRESDIECFLAGDVRANEQVNNIHLITVARSEFFLFETGGVAVDARLMVPRAQPSR